jgi:ATP-dependent DNA helicase RecQ
MSPKAAPHDILKQYWGYDQFRPLQEDIISAAMHGRDVLALLPTGGGKSVCYQVPGLCMEGLCLVISPLIALMKDQVEQLQRRGISAAAVHSGLSYREIDLLLNDALAGKLKFLYLSPERLKTEIFLARYPQMKVSLVAIDEAHCISQWGHDFRPVYMQIAEIREYHPQVPFMALTASATPKVQADILSSLALQEPRVFKKSFARHNLTFAVREVEDKEVKLLEIIDRLDGTGLIYCRSRKGTQEVAKLLKSKGIKADYYHAGLDGISRARKQEDWIQNRTRIMACTNAFGMGIDKADVRFVIHWDIPDSPEAYYQEAGRAGRDGKPSYAVLLFQDRDADELMSWKEKAWPSEADIRRTYQSLANYYRIALGSHEMKDLPFDLDDFCAKSNQSAVVTYHAIKKLEEEGYLQLSEAYHQPSRIMFAVNKKGLYEAQVSHAELDALIKALLRICGGEAFEQYVSLKEESVARALYESPDEVIKKLQWMAKAGLVYYEPRTDRPRITYTMPRQDANAMPLNIPRMLERKKTELGRAETMIRYAKGQYLCRSLYLQQYFGEETLMPCGNCDICRKRASGLESGKWAQQIIKKLEQGPQSPKQLVGDVEEDQQIYALGSVRKLLDEGKIRYDQTGRLEIFPPSDH